MLSNMLKVDIIVQTIKKHNLSFLHTSIHSIPRNSNDMNIYLENFEHTFPIIVITESCVEPNHVNEYALRGIIMNMMYVWVDFL